MMPPNRPKPLTNELLSLIRSGEAETWSPQEILTWGIKNSRPRIALSCSFGAPEGWSCST
jgi:hypothetical protein